jgi:hypothetical protein
LPKFKSLEEEADFWDTHDILEYTGETDELVVGGPKSVTLNIRVEPQVKAKLEEYASLRGEDVSDIVRNWIYLALESEMKERYREKLGPSEGADISELKRQIESLLEEKNAAVKEVIHQYERRARAEQKDIQRQGKPAGPKRSGRLAPAKKASCPPQKQPLKGTSG